MNIVLASLPLVFSPNGYHYGAYVGQCSWGVAELSFVRSSSSGLWYGITSTTIVLPWLIPGFVVIASFTISIFVLIRSDRKYKRMLSKRYRGQASAVRTRRHATVTIIIMTLVYIVFNMPCWCFYCYLLSTGFDAAWLHADAALHIHIFVSRLSVALNSAVNPAVYFLRIDGLGGKCSSRRRVDSVARDWDGCVVRSEEPTGRLGWRNSEFSRTNFKSPIP